jgi:predicted unusual protein kinase regulating ubiquinone biosynthesis (AarF/ABC1/UbiB family)
MSEVDTVQGGELSPLDNVTRTSEFWLRASTIYFGYKATQLRAFAAQVSGWNSDRIKSDLWDPQQENAASQMYSLCVDLRGFYLKAGQFLGARGDFVPEQICRKLSLLHDQVPPMPAAQVRAVIEEELGNVPMDQIFEWIDLDNPLGSASISQVHKAKLKPLPGQQYSSSLGWWARPLGFFFPFLRRSKNQIGAGTAAGVSVADNTTGTMNRSAHALVPIGNPTVDLTLAWQQAPKDGIVAVKVQYPNALPTMSLDLSNLRVLAAFLSKTELKFDMLSAVDELAKQIRLEFDFRREARIMDAVARHFEGQSDKIVVPRSVPSMVTPRLLVMNYLDGVPITRMKDQIAFQNLSEATKRVAAKRILSRVAEAYGRMILINATFQADAHPGNLMVMKGGRIGVIDYGQSKKLPDWERAQFARLILALDSGDEKAVSKALDNLGVVTERDDIEIKAEMARGMFDTTGKVDPFDPESPIKKMGITTFPAEMFFVLRVVQLLRGLQDGMEINDFSSAHQWKPFAEVALKQLRDVEVLQKLEENKDIREGRHSENAPPPPAVSAAAASLGFAMFTKPLE